MKDLIEALTILSKYTVSKHPTHCEHDVLYVIVDPNIVSVEDITKLEGLGFYVDDENGDCFKSFRYGSA